MKKHLTFFNILIIFLLVLNILPFLAPVMSAVGWKQPAKIIYFIYSFFCHQFAWRSIHIANHQCAWCTRDVFIWGSLLTVAIIVKLYKVGKLKWYWVIPFTVPIAMDGIIQTIASLLGYQDEDPLYMSTNAMRMLTGATFGTGLGLWMMPLVKEISTENERN